MPEERAKAKAEAKYMKKLSKSIWLPDDPEDPAAFTQTIGFTRTARKPWCSSKPVCKIVGTFALLMTLGIVAFILYVNRKYFKYQLRKTRSLKMSLKQMEFIMANCK